MRVPFAGLPPSGRPIEVPLVGIFDFEGDRLMCEKVYFDMATLMRSCKSALPGITLRTPPRGWG